MGFLDKLKLSLKMIRYNLKIIFGNRFIYFLLSAVVLTLLIIGINLFNGEVITEAGIYRILLITGALLLFYPTAFGLQSEKDARTLEILFGIPDYRYRVWLMRLLLIFAICVLFLIAIGELLHFTLFTYSVINMVAQVMFPLSFLGMFTFFLSTLIKTGNGTAAVVIIMSVFLLILTDELADKFWNIFYNPYESKSTLNELVWVATNRKSRIFLSVGSILFLLGGMLNLQRRERLLG